jgi:hypothetical protein
VNEVLLDIVTKTKEKYVFPTFVSCITCTTSFDMWMLHASYDTFAIIINFVNSYWEPTLVIFGVFEVQNTIGATMANQVKILLDSFGLFEKVIGYVKNEGSNLNTLTTTLKFVVSYSPFQLPSTFVGSCFGHAMSKVCH